MMQMVLLHLGAGKQNESHQYVQLMKRACLVEGRTAVDLVTHSIVVLEDSEKVNCGSGSHTTNDALIIHNGYGAITCCTDGNPIKIARYLMQQPRIVNGKMTPLMISGDAYIRKCGIYNKKIENKLDDVSEQQDTVGCIALKGNELCVGTSSGGIQQKEHGRIGSSFMYGVGGYIKELGIKKIAITSSGAGEQLLMSDFCRNAVDHFLKRDNYLELLTELIEEFMCNEILSGFPRKYIGVLLVVVDGEHVEFLYAHTTPTFFFGYSYNNKFKYNLSKLRKNQTYLVGNISIC